MMIFAHSISFALVQPRCPLFTIVEQMCVRYPGAGIFKAERSGIPGNEALLIWALFCRWTAFFTNEVPLLISRLYEHSVCSPSSSHILLLSPLPLSLIQCTSYLDPACWQAFFFFFFFLSRYMHRESCCVRKGPLFPLPRRTIPDKLVPFQNFWSFAAETFTARQVHFTRIRTFCHSRYVTAWWHLCREQPKEPATWSRVLSRPKEFKISRPLIVPTTYQSSRRSLMCLKNY